jgi:hypothetical protein
MADENVDTVDETTETDAAADDSTTDDGTAAADESPKPKAPRVIEDQAKYDFALRKANREAKERKDALNEALAKIEAMETANASEAEKAVLAAKKAAVDEADARYRPAVVKANANAALAAAGCKDADVRKTLLRLVDAKAVEISDDGDVTGGLDDQIESLKSQFPEKFTEPKPVVPSARQVDAGDKKPAPVKRTVADELAKRLTGAYPNQ